MSEPYVMGSHATCSGAWASGPEDYAPDEYQWGYNRMMTVDGLFGAGDTLGGTPHKFSSGSFTEGRLAGKAANKYVDDLGSNSPEVSEEEYLSLKEEIYQPLENYRVGRNEITAGTVSPSYILPLAGLQRLEKIMDEYCGGVGQKYMVNELMKRGGVAENVETEISTILVQTGCINFNALEPYHRVLASECVIAHTMFREETRWPGYYYREITPS